MSLLDGQRISMLLRRFGCCWTCNFDAVGLAIFDVVVVDVRQALRNGVVSAFGDDVGSALGKNVLMANSNCVYDEAAI